MKLKCITNKIPFPVSPSRKNTYPKQEGDGQQPGLIFMEAEVSKILR